MSVSATISVQNRVRPLWSGRTVGRDWHDIGVPKNLVKTGKITAFFGILTFCTFVSGDCTKSGSGLTRPRICQKCTKNRQNYGLFGIKSGPGGSKIDPGGSQIGAGGSKIDPGHLQKRPRRLKNRPRRLLGGSWVVLGGSLGVPGGLFMRKCSILEVQNQPKSEVFPYFLKFSDFLCFWEAKVFKP